MDRINEQHDDLIDLGSVSAETKGLPIGEDEDVLGPKRFGAAGLSND